MQICASKRRTRVLKSRNRIAARVVEEMTALNGLAGRLLLCRKGKALLTVVLDQIFLVLQRDSVVVHASQRTADIVAQSQIDGQVSGAGTTLRVASSRL